MGDSDEVQLTFEQRIQATSGGWYSNLQLLGQGGAAATYLMVAESGANAGNPFAVKIFRRVSRPERRDQFMHEVRFLKDCEHPGVLRVYDDGTYLEHHPFVVVEYLPRTLLDVVRGGRAALVDKLSFALQLVSTLNYLGQLHPPVIHRDIKPQNIFVKELSCVLGDFGLMKRLDDSTDKIDEEAFKQSVGPGMPFYYRTPDLVDYFRDGALPTTKSDVFQLGLVLALLFTGRNPQRRAEHDDFRSDVRLEPLGTIRGAFGEQIAGIVKSMLEYDPNNRPTTTALLEAWRGLFFEAAKRIHAVEGFVF